VWRRGAELFVEAELPEHMEAEARGFGLHPVVLDAILHGIGAGGILAESELTRLPNNAITPSPLYSTVPP